MVVGKKGVVGDSVISVGSEDISVISVDGSILFAVVVFSLTVPSVVILNMLFVVGKVSGSLVGSLVVLFIGTVVVFNVELVGLSVVSADTLIVGNFVPPGISVVSFRGNRVVLV